MESLLSMALVLALSGAPANGEQTVQPPAPKAAVIKTAEMREAERRAMVAEQQKKNAEFTRQCKKPSLTEREFAECRLAYRRLYIN